MNAEICFFRQHVGGFLDLDVVALGQVFAKSPVERAVDEYDLHLLQQVVRGGHFVQKAMAAVPSCWPAGNTRLASAWSSVSVSTKRLRPLTSLPAPKPTGPPVAGIVFFKLCVSGITAVGQAFFGPLPGCSPSGTN